MLWISDKNFEIRFFFERIFLVILGRPTKIRRPYEKWSEKNLKNRKIDFLSMKNPSFQNLIHKSLRNALKLVRVDFDRNRSSYGRVETVTVKLSSFWTIYKGIQWFSEIVFRIGPCPQLPAISEPLKMVGLISNKF